MNKLNWTEKYRPRTLSQVAGHPKLIQELKEWAEEWQYGSPKNKAVTLYGRAGTGKTTTAYALANDMRWEVIELNASDQRTAKVIEKIAGSSSKMGSISGSKRLIIVDEADNIHGTADRGGEKAVIRLIKETNQPIILTANNYYDMSIGLRNVCKPIRFRNISVGTIISVLRNIANAENIICVPGVIEKIADDVEGDLRSAINDLEAISLGKTKLETQDIVTGYRDIQKNIFKVLEKILKEKDINVYKSTYTLDENPEDLINWIDENLPLQYAKIDDLAKGYEYISKASVFLGRVRKRQNYDMWKYATILMTSGVSIVKSQENKMYVKYQSPLFWKRLGEKKRIRIIRDSVAKKIGNKCHVSMRYTKLQLLSFFKMLMKDEKYALSIAASLDLNEDEIEFLTSYNIEVIQKIYNDAQAIMKKEKESDIELFGKFGEWATKEQQKEEKEQEDDRKDKSQSSLFDY